MKYIGIFVGMISLLVSTNVLAQDQLTVNSAITFKTTGYNTWYLDEGVRNIGDIQVSGVKDFVGNTFTLSIPHEFPIIFVNNTSLIINGTSQGITYSSDRTDLYFTAPSANVVVQGVEVKIYDKESPSRDHFLLDVDADGIFDARDTNEIEVDDNSSRNEDDELKPEVVPNLQASVVENGVKITWIKPVDLDVRDIFVQRTLNGNYKELFWNQNNLEYIDTDVKTGDSVKYIIQARDVYFLGDQTEMVLNNVQLPEEGGEAQVPDATVEEPTDEGVDQTPVDQGGQEEMSNQVYSRSEVLSMAVAAMSYEKTPVERIKAIRAQIKAFENVIHRLIFMRRVVEISEERKAQ